MLEVKLSSNVAHQIQMSSTATLVFQVEGLSLLPIEQELARCSYRPTPSHQLIEEIANWGRACGGHFIFKLIDRGLDGRAAPPI